MFRKAKRLLAQLKVIFELTKEVVDATGMSQGYEGGVKGNLGYGKEGGLQISDLSKAYKVRKGPTFPRLGMGVPID